MTLAVGIIVVLLLALVGAVYELGEQGRTIRDLDTQVSRLVLQRDQALEKLRQLRLAADERARPIVRPAIPPAPDGFLDGATDMYGRRAGIDALEQYANGRRAGDPGE